MAETTRALITEEDARVAWRVAGIGTPEGHRAVLNAVAPALRARWVAEALDEIAAGLRIRYMSTPGGRATAQAAECLEIANRMRDEAAEYRAGSR